MRQDFTARGTYYSVNALGRNTTGLKPFPNMGLFDVATASKLRLVVVASLQSPQQGFKRGRRYCIAGP